MSQLKEKIWIPVRVTLDLSEWRMLLEMFAIIEDQHALGGDMLSLFQHLKEQLEGVFHGPIRGEE